MSKVVNISQWTLNRKTRMLDLPSGAVVEVIENHLLPLITNAILPLALLSRVQQMGASKDGAMSGDQAKVIESYNKLMLLVTEIVVNPKLITEGIPGPGEVSLAQVPGDDLQALIQYMIRGREAGSLVPFRAVTGGAAAGCDVPEVHAAAVGGNGAAGA